MKVLVIGGGGREHALAWKCAQSAHVETVFVAPGNAGTAVEPGVENLAIDADDLAALQAFALREDIGLTIVGPEMPLVAGIVDAFQAAGLTIFGPTRAAAQLEGSKSYSKDFLQRHGIPTAAYESFTDSPAALDYLARQAVPIVVKADGLAAGKGVVLAQSHHEAAAAVRAILDESRFGSAGRRVVIEEFLTGEEVSFICLVDGEDVLPLATSQDHKARDDGDAGPNTGGMGAYTPAPLVDDALHREILRQVIMPTVRGMRAEGNQFTGFLYAGLMISSQGVPNVLEFNVRFGDPETQPILMRLRSDLVELCLAAASGRLAGSTVVWDERPALGVVMAAGGYPENYRKGDVIDGLDLQRKDVKVFHAGTARAGADTVTAGGRVLCVTALGVDVAAAQRTAYEAVAGINWKDCYYRRDIGHRAVARGA